MKNRSMLGHCLVLVLFSSFRMLNNFSKEFVDEKFSPLDYSRSITHCLLVEKMDVLGKFEDYKFREIKMAIISCPGITLLHP